MYKDVYRNNADLEMQKHARPFGGRSNPVNNDSPFAIGVKIPKNYNWIQSTDDDLSLIHI